ncbi:reverse transcriptase [Gossypium australe]|uniref:Reverse transcriptase n=1 Tax=Gossypium australe TaxID=47621 RepID=A0A5B6WY06_9ROSI|nr:reverse transcriptase [Gossypium australe]
MAAVARSYFQGLFQIEGVSKFEHSLSGVDRCVSDDDNRRLAMAFTNEEIWEALTSMGATKAPGEDGFPALFFLKLWHIFGDEVSFFCLQQLNGEMEVNRVNSTHIVFIPKKVRPTGISHFQPITYEILNALKKERMRRKELMAIKLDMSKAYDRVEWIFFKKMMERMRFELRWINLIMQCISTVSYSIILNRQIGNNFYPSRGLQQGNPLSPFLFLICGVSLSSLMRLAQREEHFRGVKASRSGPQISHLLFADDCILFGEATEIGAGQLKRMLRECSTNTTEAVKELITRTLGIRSSNHQERYLGLPNMVGRWKKEAFQILKDRFRQNQ